MSLRKDRTAPPVAGDRCLPVVRFRGSTGHGWYVGNLGVWGLIAGESDTWPTRWEQYSEQTGIRVTDLTFACRQDFVDFVRDIGW